MRKLLTVGLIALSTVATANCCDFDGCFEVGGEALYWKPTGADWQYALVTPGSLTSFPQETKRVVGDYDWGFRIFGSYYSDDCCNFMTLDWTYLRTRDADSVTSQADPGPVVIPWLFSEDLIGAFDIVGRLRFDYDKVNLRFGRHLCSGCNSRIYAYGGARYVEIEERRSYFLDDDSVADLLTVDYQEKTRFQGGGLEAGFGGEYDIWCDLSLVANIGLTAEVGELKSGCTKDLTFDAFGDIFLSTRIASRTICVPGAELRLGLDYTYKCDCVWICGELGYQMDYRWNALGLLEGQPIVSIPTSKRTSVGFGGLYFGLRARF